MPVGFADIRAVASDHEAFSSCQITISRPPVTKPFHMPPMSADPPAHKIFRDFLQPFFSLKNAGRFQSHSESAAKRRLTTPVALNGGDYVGGVILPYVIDVFVQILGVPVAEQKEISQDILRIASTNHLNVEALRVITYPLELKINKLLAYRRKNAGDDLPSFLINAQYNGLPVPNQILVTLLRLVIIAGVPTTASAIAEGLACLIGRDNRQLVQFDGSSWKLAVEEILRFSSPAMLARRCVLDRVVGGLLIKSGGLVLLPYAAGNRDPEVFEHPHSMMLDRRRNRHMAFGFGIHSCLGMHLARILIDTFLRYWVESIGQHRRFSVEEIAWFVGPVYGRRKMVIQPKPGG